MSNVCDHGVNFYKKRCFICRPLERPKGSSMQGDLYQCASRKCNHRFKHSELVFVMNPPRPGPKTLPSSTGACPKCGHKSFRVVKTHNPEL